MDIIQRARSVLSDAEQSLRELMLTAISSGEYTNLAVVAGWAEQIATIKANENRPSVNAAAQQGGESFARATESVGEELIVNGSAQPSRNTQKRPRRGKKGSKSPTFVREQDKLVKIGWSKSENAEYEHKASWIALESVCNALLRQKSRRFRVEGLHVTAPDASTIPVYQVYLCIAWLRATGRIEQHGRKGYSIPKPTEFLQQVETDWNKLPQR